MCYLRSLVTPLTSSRPIFLSSPDLVRGMPVVLAIFLFITSMPSARRIENDVPGIPMIFISVTVLLFLCCKSIPFERTGCSHHSSILETFMLPFSSLTRIGWSLVISLERSFIVTSFTSESLMALLTGLAPYSGS